MEEADPILKTKGLKKYYSRPSGGLSSILGNEANIKAVDGVDVEIYRGDILGIVGESGSGKSTLGETILRLEEPTAGTIEFQGEDITQYSEREIREFRQNAQIIFQDPYSSLNPKKTIKHIVSEPLRNFDVESDDEAITNRVVDILHDVGLRPPTEVLDSYPDELSGGQRQRIAIARALILEPDLLIADEPMSMLDVSIQSQIIKILTDLQSKLGYGLMYISHNLSVVNLLADRISVMYRGKIVETGAADALLHNPKHPYTQALIESLPDLTTERERVLFDTFTEEASSVKGCSFHPRCPKRMDECTKSVPALEEAENRKISCYLYHSKSEEQEAVKGQSQ